MEDGVKVKGTFRIVLTEDGFKVGDSGWVTNTVTNRGFEEYITGLMVSDANSNRVTHAALGTGAVAINATQTLLTSELTHAAGARAAITAATSSTSSRARYTATFASSDNFITAQVTIGEVGLFQTSTTNAATLGFGNTFTTSALATNQNVNLTYDIDFS